MASNDLLLLIIAAPAAAAALILLTPARAARLVEALHLASITLVTVGVAALVVRVLGTGNVSALHDALAVDALGSIFLGLIAVVGFLAGIYSIGYIRHDLEAGALDARRLRLYYGLFNLFLATMLLSAAANNIVLMWIAIEATTLGSTFLVGLYGQRSSLEAAWKYVILCTVGVAFGLYGAVLTYANGTEVLQNAEGAILWTTLAANAGSLDPVVMKIAFVFVLIGFGTKAGLFPMHAWLPDAHSEAPSPISALMSGVLLKCAMLIVIRYYVLTVKAVGPDFPQTLLLTLGTLSIAVSALIFVVQRDLKRKLAYSSIEHLGLIALGLGIGGPLGVGAALLHVINHSFTKALLFFGSGAVLQKYGTRDLGAVRGLMRVAPFSGFLIIGGALALAGLPPFGIFVSELLVFVAGLKSGHYVLMLACALLFTATVGALVALVAESILGKAPPAVAKRDIGFGMLAPMAALLVLTLVMGVAMPQPVSRMLQAATSIVTGAPTHTAVLVLPWQRADESPAVAATDRGAQPIAAIDGGARGAAQQETKP